MIDDTNASNQNHLPINISDGDEDMILDYDDEHSNTEDDRGIAMKNVADWTTIEQQQDTINNKKKQETVSIDNSSEEEEEEGEKEYHGEIESITSAHDNKLDTDPSANDAVNTHEEEQELFKIPSENTISVYPPPPTKPLVLVSLQELCGCLPETQEEKVLLVSDLMDSLLGSTKDDNKEKDKEDKEEENTNKKKEKSSSVLGDGLSLEFDERITELFDSNVASHVDSSYPIAISCLEDDKNTKEEGKEKVVTPYAIIPYPEFLSDEITNPTTLNTTTSVRSTVRLWKLLYTLPITTTDEHPRISNLLSKIFCHLRNTSRSLLWKADMYTNICHLSKSEYKHQIKRQQLQEYNVWKTSGRSERLEKLYEVRDTFVLQVDVAKKRYNLLVEEREGRVDRELRRRGLFGEVKDTVENVQGSTTLVGGGGYEQHEEDDYDDDGWGGTICEDDILGEETNISRQFIDATVQEDEEFENDEWAPVETGINPLGMDIAVDGPVVAPSADNESSESQDKKIKQANKNKVTNKLEPISHDDNIKRKSDRKQRKQDKTSRTEYLKREQETIRETLKSNDERIAEATLLKLEEKLQTVDSLLESLQEEEWEAEEEEGHNSFAFEDEKDQGVGNDGSMEGSLLDRILAMILGGLPREKDSEGNDIKTEKEHYVYIGEEHKAIVKEWIDVFGRLPQTFPSPEPPEPQHEVWPEDTFGDETIPSETMFLENKGSNDIKLIGNENGNWDD